MRLAFTPTQLFDRPSFDYKRRVSVYADHLLNAPFEAPLLTSVSERSHTVFVSPSFSGTGRDITQVMSLRKSSLRRSKRLNLAVRSLSQPDHFTRQGFIPAADRIMFGPDVSFLQDVPPMPCKRRFRDDTSHDVHRTRRGTVSRPSREGFPCVPVRRLPAGLPAHTRRSFRPVLSRCEYSTI